MANHTSATVDSETPHVTETSRTISTELKRRAVSVINDKSIDAQTRAVIRYGLEINDPSLADLVRRADAGDTIIDTIDFSETADNRENDSSKERVEALADMICQAGGETAAALLVLMATLQRAHDPKALAHTVKHLAFTRCGELNVGGMVDAQIAVLQDELFAGNAFAA